MENIREIYPGMTSERMQFSYFDANSLRVAPYEVFQLNSKGHRYYYRFNEEGEPEFYPSVTTILSQTMPKPAHLINWIGSKGIEEAERYKNERAAYGTFMHAAFEELLIARKYNLDDLKTKLKKYIEQNSLPDDFIYYADDLKSDILAFAQFVKDYDVRPIAIEIALVHPEKNYAGMIDLICNMQAKPGSEERIIADVDFKSGRKAFYEDNEIQLHFYKELWNFNFPDFPVERVFNFSPKDWKKKPSYNLKDQTNSPSAAKIPFLLELAAIEDKKSKQASFTYISGEVDLDSDKGFEDNIITLSLSEVVKGANEEETPGEEEGLTETDLFGEIF